MIEPSTTEINTRRAKSKGTNPKPKVICQTIFFCGSLQEKLTAKLHPVRCQVINVKSRNLRENAQKTDVREDRLHTAKKCVK